MRLLNNKRRQEQAILATMAEIAEIETAIQEAELDPITGEKILRRLYTKIERQRDNLDVTDAQIRVANKNALHTLSSDEKPKKGNKATT